MSGTRRGIGLIVVGAAGMAGIGWALTTRAQPAPGRTRFEFLVVESYDAQYLGDTPGHIGKAGGLGHTAPNVALGDPVYHDKARIGEVTHLTWDEAKESLEVEFDPEAGRRIYVGEPVWIPIGGQPGAKR